MKKIAVVVASLAISISALADNLQSIRADHGVLVAGYIRKVKSAETEWNATYDRAYKLAGLEEDRHAERKEAKDTNDIFNSDISVAQYIKNRKQREAGANQRSKEIDRWLKNQLESADKKLDVEVVFQRKSYNAARKVLEGRAIKLGMTAAAAEAEFDAKVLEPNSNPFLAKDGQDVEKSSPKKKTK